MAENQTSTSPAEDLDFDEWINGGARKAHYVTLYSRADLLADIEELTQRRAVEKVVDSEPTLGGGASGASELDGQLADLYQQLNNSRREFRISGLSSVELEEIRAQVRKDLKDEADRVAADAREDAKAMAKRIGLVATNDINNFLRGKALEAANALIEGETSIRALATTTVTRHRGEWVAVSEDQFRRLLKVIGAQVDLLNRAFSRAANEAPVVTVPKS